MLEKKKKKKQTHPYPYKQQGVTNQKVWKKKGHQRDEKTKNKNRGKEGGSKKTTVGKGFGDMWGWEGIGVQKKKKKGGGLTS